jgi:hypothetical protein
MSILVRTDDGSICLEESLENIENELARQNEVLIQMMEMMYHLVSNSSNYSKELHELFDYTYKIVWNMNDDE